MKVTEGLQVKDLEDPAGAFEQMVEILCSMTRVGLVHCDFNEFNVLLCDSGNLIAIDFPQMVSVSHANAKMLFERDLNSIIRFFTQKLKYNLATDDMPCWEELLQEIDAVNAVDFELHASGFNNVEKDSAPRQQKPQRKPKRVAASGAQSEVEGDAGAECSDAIREMFVEEVSGASEKGTPSSCGGAVKSTAQLQEESATGSDEVGRGESGTQCCESGTQDHEGDRRGAQEQPDSEGACCPDSVDALVHDLDEGPQSSQVGTPDCDPSIDNTLFLEACTRFLFVPFVTLRHKIV